MALGRFLDRVSGRLFPGRRAEAVSAPVLREARRFPYGPFSFRADVTEDASYTVAVSSDLVNWITMVSGLGGNERMEYLDVEAAKYSQRFYRVLADGVRSTTVVGFVAMTLPPGFSLIGNPLRCVSNSVGELFKSWPDGTSLHKFDTRLFKLNESAIVRGRWSRPAETLGSGEGAIFFNPTNDYKSHTFVGEVLEGNLSTPIPAGFSLRSSLVPQPGNLSDDLRFPVADGDEIHLFDRDQQKYVIYPFADGKWKGPAPILGAGEAFWVAKKAAANWTRSLNLR
jgi:hypothetical protein